MLLYEVDAQTEQFKLQHRSLCYPFKPEKKGNSP